MSRADRISGVFWFVFAILVCIESYRLGLGTLHQPGPGFLFFWTSIFLAIMSLIVLARAWGLFFKQTEEEHVPIFGDLNKTKLITVTVALFLYAVFMEVIGFIPITLLFFIFILGIIEKKSWFYSIFVSVAVTVVSYLIFETWLQSQLPRGLLDFVRF